MLNRSSPYVAIFGSTPARISSAPVGASVYASGCQAWNGTIGAFTANATRNPRNSHRPVFTAKACCASTRMSNVCAWKYTNSTARNRNADPAIV
jgi:hypothetical protein